MTDSRGLFSDMKGDYVIPFVFVKRDSVMTDDQVQNILGDLITAGNIKVPVLLTSAFLGVALCVVGACVCKKLNARKNKMQGYDYMERMKLIDETNYANGLKKDNINSVSSADRGSSVVKPPAIKTKPK